MTDSISSVGCFVGIDVAKDKLDLARSDTSQVLTVAHDPQSIRSLVDLLTQAKPTVIALEATGGLEQALVDAFLEASLPVAVVNPGHVRHFAKATGALAKTDHIDARILMRFAQLTGPRLAQKRSENQRELEALVTCRRQLVQVRTEQTNRRGTTTSKSALCAIDAVLKTLNRQIQDLDQQIRKLIESDDDFHSLDQLLRTVPGVGAITSATMLSELNELGQTDRRQISSLVGLAPFNQDSGKHKGKRRIRGGRWAVRSVLYMATVAAIRCNPVIRSFAQKLQKSGKAGKVVITACMRKLLTLLNAMLRDHLTWDQLKVVKTLDN